MDIPQCPRDWSKLWIFIWAPMRVSQIRGAIDGAVVSGNILSGNCYYKQLSRSFKTVIIIINIKIKFVDLSSIIFIDSTAISFPPLF